MRWLVLTLLLLPTIACKTGEEAPKDAPKDPPAASKAPEPKDFLSEINALATRSLKDKGVVKTECPPMITPAMTEFDCVSDGVALNGPRKVPVHVTLKSKGSYDFTMQTVIIDATKAKAEIPKALDNQVKDPDCGAGIFYMNVGESIVCKAIDINDGQQVDIVGKLKDKDTLIFNIKLKLKPL